MKLFVQVLLFSFAILAFNSIAFADVTPPDTAAAADKAGTADTAATADKGATTDSAGTTSAGCQTQDILGVNRVLFGFLLLMFSLFGIRRALQSSNRS